MRKMPDLVYLCLSYIGDNIKLFKGIGYLETLPYNMKERLLRKMTGISGSGLDDAILKELLFRDLKNINLSLSTITDTTLSHISRYSPNLESMILSGGTYLFTAEGLTTFIPQLLHLNHLDISRTNEIDDDFIETLAKNCKYLEYLDLSMCQKITDVSVRALKDLKIHQLSLSWTQVTDESLRMLGGGICSNYLVDLNISYCKCTSAGLDFLRWDVIQNIELFGCLIEDTKSIRMNNNTKFVQWSIPFPTRTRRLN